MRLHRAQLLAARHAISLPHHFAENHCILTPTQLTAVINNHLARQRVSIIVHQCLERMICHLNIVFLLLCSVKLKRILVIAELTHLRLRMQARYTTLLALWIHTIECGRGY